MEAAEYSDYYSNSVTRWGSWHKHKEANPEHWGTVDERNIVCATCEWQAIDHETGLPSPQPQSSVLTGILEGLTTRSTT